MGSYRISLGWFEWPGLRSPFPRGSARRNRWQVQIWYETRSSLPERRLANRQYNQWEHVDTRFRARLTILCEQLQSLHDGCYWCSASNEFVDQMLGEVRFDDRLPESICLKFQSNLAINLVKCWPWTVSAFRAFAASKNNSSCASFDTRVTTSSDWIITSLVASASS